MRVPPPGLRACVNSDSEMQRFESSRPIRPVRLQRIRNRVTRLRLLASHPAAASSVGSGKVCVRQLGSKLRRKNCEQGLGSRGRIDAHSPAFAQCEQRSQVPTAAAFATNPRHRGQTCHYDHADCYDCERRCYRNRYCQQSRASRQERDWIDPLRPTA